MSAFVLRDLLDPSGEDIFAARRHNMYFLILLIPVLIIFPLIIWFAYRARRSVVDKFFFDRRHLYICQGLWHKDEYMVSLIQVRGLEFTQGLLGKLFNYGTIIVDLQVVDKSYRVKYGYVCSPEQITTELNNRICHLRNGLQPL